MQRSIIWILRVALIFLFETIFLSPSSGKKYTLLGSIDRASPSLEMRSRALDWSSLPGGGDRVKSPKRRFKQKIRTTVNVEKIDYFTN
jgi:hypothetical protein